MAGTRRQGACIALGVLFSAGCGGAMTTAAGAGGGGKVEALRSAASPSGTASGAPTSTAGVEPGPLLAFESSAGPRDYSFTIVAPGGDVVSQSHGPNGASLFQGTSRALLLAGDAVLHRDGSITAVAAAAKDLLSHPSGINGDPIVVNDHTALLTADGEAEHRAAYVEVDLVSGEERTLVSVDTTTCVCLPGEVGITPLGPSADWQTVYLRFSPGVTVGGEHRDHATLATIDVASGSLLRQTPLPDDDPDIAVSPDGRLVAYTRAGSDSQNRAVYTTHITDLATGHDVAVDDVDRSSVPSGNSRGFRFSPSGSRLAACGGSGPAQSGPIGCSVMSAATGDVLWRLTRPRDNHYAIDPVGWLDDHRFAYAITVTATPGIFNDAGSTGHVVDVESANDLVSISGRGSPISILG